MGDGGRDRGLDDSEISVDNDHYASLMQSPSAKGGQGVCCYCYSQQQVSCMTHLSFCYLVIDKLVERITTRVAVLLIKAATVTTLRRKARKRRCMMPKSVKSSAFLVKRTPKQPVLHLFGTKLFFGRLLG